jgi:hypothetical protein
MSDPHPSIRDWQVKGARLQSQHAPDESRKGGADVIVRFVVPLQKKMMEAAMRLQYLPNPPDQESHVPTSVETVYKIGKSVGIRIRIKTADKTGG